MRANAIFAGLMPSEIETRFPGSWLNDEEEGSKEHARRRVPHRSSETFPQGLQTFIYKGYEPCGRKVIGGECSQHDAEQAQRDCI